MQVKNRTFISCHWAAVCAYVYEICVAQSGTDRKGVTPVLLNVVRHSSRVHGTSLLLCLSTLEKRGGGMNEGWMSVLYSRLHPSPFLWLNCFLAFPTFLCPFSLPCYFFLSRLLFLLPWCFLWVLCVNSSVRLPEQAEVLQARGHTKKGRRSKEKTKRS